ncbi:hypothetical protein P8452_16612 [Trifolium repens]|nr:hypothetical protein P8452_16612 [Trifolium repens]
MDTHQTKYQESPESSTANQDPKIPAFSFYPEQVIEEGVRACQSSILGKIITDKSIHVGSIQNGLDSIWGSPAGLKIQEIEGKILQFYMNNVVDHDRIILGNPWIFRNSWLIVKPWDREIDPRTLDFDHAPIWVQLWGLPPHCKTKAMERHLGALMGDVEESELYEYPGKQMIIKIKVAINVHKPITSGIHLSNPTDGTCWVDYRYEKLPQVCFKCGLLGHADDRNFYGIFSIIISSKMTKTGPNTKENLQKQEKASRQSPRCKRQEKAQKVKKISIPSQHDCSHRATMGAAYSPRNQKQ